MIASFTGAGYLFLSASVNWGMIVKKTKGCG